jgi:hypothetical protein
MKTISARSSVLAAAASLALATPALAQLSLPRPSPGATVTQTIGLTDVTIVYSRPGAKGRVIWGGLVPYDKPWRTGANASTTVAFGDPVTVEGKPLAAGTYSLYTIPGRGEWTVVFNSDPKASANEWDPKKDALRVNVKPTEAPAFTEWMEFEFEALTPRSADLALYWDKLRVAMKVETDTDAKALAGARDAVAKAKPDDWQTPYRAANYMIDASAHQDEAEKWLAKSLAAKQNFFNVAAKAKLLAAAGKTKEALAEGDRALALAQTAEPKADADATAPFKKLMAEWKAKG